MTGISPLLDDQNLYERLQEILEMGKFQASIGYTYALVNKYLVDNNPTACESTNSNTT